MSESMGLTELIEKVKQDLLATTDKGAIDAPVFFVDTVELELKVSAKRDTGGGIKIDVLPFIPIGAGADMKANVSYENAHTIKVKLSPLYDKAKILEWQHTRNPQQAMKSLDTSRAALLKNEDDDEENLADR